MKFNAFKLFLLVFCLGSISCRETPQEQSRSTKFNNDWKFSLNNNSTGLESPGFDDAAWRTLDLPHDWAIEGDFSKDNPSRADGGALPGGTGWYRKTFMVDKKDMEKKFFIDFDGVYMNSEVYLNGHLLGKRPYGYISFRYDMTPFLDFDQPNVLAVKVDNSQQPNSRWYSGCGIYRHVWLTVLDPVHVDHWGIHVTTPEVSKENARFAVSTTVKNDKNESRQVEVTSILLDSHNKELQRSIGTILVAAGEKAVSEQSITLTNPEFWSVKDPYLYKIKTELRVNGELTDTYYTNTGVRTFSFDAETGFSLNGERMKINGVCMHHDLGCLGAAVNRRAIERQLEILKEMGCNAIRSAHNPPAPELLDLCDRMGFIVMDETFDMWRKRKTQYDYAQYFDEWHERDQDDLILRDRNHPSIFMWSIGNEVSEQWMRNNHDTLSVEEANYILNFGFDKSQLAKEGEMSVNSLLTKKLANRARALDPTRPVLAGCHEPSPDNHLFRSGALDIIGYNYHHEDFMSVPENFPGKPFLITESISGLMTRGYYRMPSDSMFVWPIRDKNQDRTAYENANLLCSSYDNCHVPWGSNHETGMRYVKNNDFISGQFVWTGFDYIGEPTPFTFPARSSYFGIIDLAGFPKDIYYMYQSEWSDKDMLHLFPHWNWEEGEDVDMWAYYSNADEVELFVNGSSKGIRRKGDDDFHVCWRVKFEPGIVKAVSRKDGEVVMEKEIRTAGQPAAIRLTPDRDVINADGTDLSFVTVEIVDTDGNLCPNADNLVNFEVSGNAFIAGVDNGSQYSMERFKDDKRKAFYGKCLVVLQNNGEGGKASLKALSDELRPAEIKIQARK